MDKNAAILLFEKCCSDVFNYKYRATAITSQYNRRAWELYFEDGKGKIRIDATAKPFTIIVWSMSEQKKEFVLTAEEYEHLRKCFFGDIKPDPEYLKMLNRQKA